MHPQSTYIVVMSKVCHIEMIIDKQCLKERQVVFLSHFSKKFIEYPNLSDFLEFRVA